VWAGPVGFIGFIPIAIILGVLAMFYTKMGWWGLVLGTPMAWLFLFVFGQIGLKRLFWIDYRKM
jgi:hypothetical protein